RVNLHPSEGRHRIGDTVSAAPITISKIRRMWLSLYCPRQARTRRDRENRARSYFLNCHLKLSAQAALALDRSRQVQGFEIAQGSPSDDSCLQACDFILHQQLATLQLHDLEIVDRRMGAGFDYFSFQGPMPSFQFRKMSFYGHIGESPESDRGLWSGAARARFGRAGHHNLPR